MSCRELLVSPRGHEFELESGSVKPMNDFDIKKEGVKGRRQENPRHSLILMRRGEERRREEKSGGESAAQWMGLLNELCAVLCCVSE
jgi:hypothetical protein